MPTRLMPITVRLDEDFYDTIKRMAKSEGRSINKQMVLFMEIGYEHYIPNTIKKAGGGSGRQKGSGKRSGNGL